MPHDSSITGHVSCRQHRRSSLVVTANHVKPGVGSNTGQALHQQQPPIHAVQLSDVH